MRVGRILRGAAALSMCVIGSQTVIAGSVDERFPFLAATQAARTPEPKVEAPGAAPQRMMAAPARSSHRRRTSSAAASPEPFIPYPRPAPQRAEAPRVPVPGETTIAFADPNDPAIEAASAGNASSSPAQTIAARMAPLGAVFTTASRSSEDPIPETRPPASANSDENLGGPFVPTPKRRAASRTADDIVILVENIAVAHGVPLELAHAVVRVESNYNPTLTGRGGTLGLMQIKYATARGLGYSGTAKALMDPAVNLEWGMRYLAGARKLAKGNVCGTILRYQAGHRAVRMTHAAAQYCGRVRHIMAAIR